MHVVYSLQPGGMELGVVKLVNGLNRAAVRSSICSTTPGGALKSLVANDVAVLELRRRKGNDPRLVWNLYQVFRRERPDIVHTHAWGTLLEGLVAARLARVPIVVHGEHGTLQLKRRQRVAQRIAWKAADRMLSVSSRLAERISHDTGLPLARMTVIRNGVDLNRFQRVDRADARARLGFAEDELVAIAVGRLVPVKDHVTLLEATALARCNGRRFTLAIAGDGPLRTTLEERARALGLDAAVRFLGHRADVETVLAAADLFVLSSVSEGLSNTILEAMATGLPVVATRVGGADEMVEDGVTGVLVPASSPSEMAAALTAVFADADVRRTMGTRGRGRAEAEFSLETMVRRYESLYLELARAADPATLASRTGERVVGASR
jgi:sugar transferase (PEP-CTERM/EpsH1 system associated)